MTIVTACRRVYRGSVFLLTGAAFVAGCGNPAPEAGTPPAAGEASPYGITVTPPDDGDENLVPIRFVVRNGARAISDGATQCHLGRIETGTMRVTDNTEQAEDFSTLAPGAEHAVHCDPLVFLDPGSGVRVIGAQVTVDLEFSVDGMPDRQFARFTFDASRNAQGQLRWTPSDTTAGAAATRYQ